MPRLFSLLPDWRWPLPRVAASGGAIVGSAVLLAAHGVGAHEHHRPAGRDAFSTVQVDTTAELVALLKRNPILRRSYARHFKIPEREVIRFVKEALVPARLTRARKITTYGVTRTGKIYAVRQILPKGARVWATRTGSPILKWLCANPLVTQMPGTRVKPAVVATLPQPDALPLQRDVGLREDIETVASERSAETIMPGGGGGGIPVPEVVAVDAGPGDFLVTGEAQTRLPRVSSPESGIWLGLPLLGLFDSPHVSPAVVPEPGSLTLLLTAGLLGVGIARRRRLVCPIANFL